VITPATLAGALLVKPALVLAGAACVAVSLRRQPAAARHALWVGALAAVLLLPLFGALVPALPVGLLPGQERPANRPPPVGSPGMTTPAFAAGTPPGAAPIGLARSADRREAIGIGLLLVWALGVVALGYRRIAAEVGLRRVIRRGRPARPSEKACRRYRSQGFR
jgi:hypothetical protein